MITSIVERLSSVTFAVIYGCHRDSKSAQVNLLSKNLKTDLCCPCFTSSSSISSPRHHYYTASAIKESYPDPILPTSRANSNKRMIEKCKKWRWLIKKEDKLKDKRKVAVWRNDELVLDRDERNYIKSSERSSLIGDTEPQHGRAEVGSNGSKSAIRQSKKFVVVVDLDSNNNETNDNNGSGDLQNQIQSFHLDDQQAIKPSATETIKSPLPVTVTLEGPRAEHNRLDNQLLLKRRSAYQHQNASLDEESICSSKDASSALTGKKSASLYFHQICDELPPFSAAIQVQQNNKKNKNNNSETNIANNKKNSKKDLKSWESETGEKLSASLESNLPGNQPNILGGSLTGIRKQSLTVPEELKFHHHHHHHHHRRRRAQGQHSRDASPEDSSIQYQHYLLHQETPSSHHHPHPHQSQQSRVSSSMGHQQLEHRSDEGTIEETCSPKCKTEPSRSPSPLSTPSPSGSASFQFFSRPFDDQSIGSSCSSSGIELEFTRKCTVSADSLLLHPDITGSSSGHGVSTVNLGGAMGGGSRMGHHYHSSTSSSSRHLAHHSHSHHPSHPSHHQHHHSHHHHSHHLSSEVSGSAGTCCERDEAKPMSSDSSLEAGKGYSSSSKSGLNLLDPGSLVRRKISGSLSSDQIHTDLMFSDKVTLTPGTRSVSPKMIFTGKFRRDKGTSTSLTTASSSANSPSTSRSAADQQPTLSTPSHGLGATASNKNQQQPPSSPSVTTASRSPGSTEKRKASVANVVLSGPGRLARLLRRTHSAGCSKDVPSHALFLREKPMKHHASSSTPTTEGEIADKRRGRKQAPALEDMKQRLRFLRRRHTDSSIQSTNVRPTPEEAHKWSESFQLLMRSKYGATLFKAFLAREYSQENIEFWIACEEFKKVRPAKMPSKARKIYDDFVAVKSPKEINLDPNLRTNILQSLTAPEESTFDIAQRKIQGMLEQDAYLRFLQSELYRDLLVASEPASKKADATQYESSSGKLSPESHL